MKVYGIIHDAGDGSAHVRWYSKESADYVLSDEYEYVDDVQMNEGSPAVVLTLLENMFPEDLGIELSG